MLIIILFFSHLSKMISTYGLFFISVNVLVPLQNLVIETVEMIRIDTPVKSITVTSLCHIT